MPKFRFFRLRPRNRAHAERKPRTLTRGQRPNDKLRREIKEVVETTRRAQQARRPGRPLVPLRNGGTRLRPLRRVPTVREEVAFLEELPTRSVGDTLADLRRLAPGSDQGTVCQKRYIRQQVLFAQGVAGKKGRSPGKGGTYKRTPESEVSCERSL